MALCLAESLVEKGGFDPRDQMDRYCRWWTDGYLSCNGQCFDIGNTVASALRRYQSTDDPFSGSTDPQSAGNGSIMRLAPIPMFFFPEEGAVVKYAGESSRTTYGAIECIDACRVLALAICRALAGLPKDDILRGESLEIGSPRVRAIACGAYAGKGESDIRGSGYVVESLEAALWCFAETESFEASILRAANLGDDADTTAAICGQVAGAHYGEFWHSVADGLSAWRKGMTLLTWQTVSVNTVVERMQASVSGGDPPAVPGRHPEFDSSGSGMRHSLS